MATDKQRREAERRRLQRQMERRRQQQQRRKRTNLIISAVGTIIVIVAVIVLIVATNGGDSKNPAAHSPANTPSAPLTSQGATSSAPTYPCGWTTTGSAARAATKPKSTTPPKTGKVTVSVATTQGPMTFALDRALAPCTVESFVSLAEQKYYDSTPCHRLTTGGIYVLQCGDPTGTGQGGPGYSIPDEATGKEQYPAGTIAMARSSAPHTGGSQFFIVYKDSPNLMQQLGKLQYTVFGKVSSGLNVVIKVAAAGAATGTDGKPKLPITLTKLAVR
ncbi:MAG: peptidylprolyl isomerase [Jatrophihabitans sp.]